MDRSDREDNDGQHNVIYVPVYSPTGHEGRRSGRGV